MRDGLRQRRNGLRLLLLVALGATLLLGAQTASTAASVRPKVTRIGIAYGDSLTWLSDQGLASALDDAVALHAPWVRVDLSWADISPDGPREHLWSRFDRVVQAARARGLKVLPTLAYTPAWARRQGCQIFTCPPAHIAAFVRFARAAARRYAADGVHTWEIWNEENLSTFWPQPDADRYARLLRASTRAIKAQDPHARVLMGGLSALGGSPGTVDPRRFLSRVCAAGGCRGLAGVGYHPYTFPYLASDVTSWGTAWNRIDETRWSLRSVLDRWGHPRMKIWATEYGAPTGGPGAASDGSPASITPLTDHVTEDRQAQIASDAVRTAVASPDVAALFWYTDRDDPAYSGTEAYFGLRRSDGSAKPAWYAFEAAARRAAGP